jgi:hypothetical protein
VGFFRAAAITDVPREPPVTRLKGAAFQHAAGHWNRPGTLLDVAVIRPSWAAPHPPTPAAQLQKPD